jgi:hypothetical protein
MNDETLRLIKDKFVPAVIAPNHRGLYLPSDKAVFEKYFKAPGHPSGIKGAACLPGRGSLFPFTAGGQPIQVDGALGLPINRQLHAVLDKFAALPEAERAPAEARVKPDTTALKHKVEPPPHGLTLRTFSRYLVRDGRGGYRPAKQVGAGEHVSYEWMPDYAAEKKQAHAVPTVEPPTTDTLWVTEAEWRGLLRPHPKKGDTFAVAESLTRRICLYGFHIYDSSESIPTWTFNAPRPLDFIKEARLDAVVDEVTRSAVVLRLQGSFRLDRQTPIFTGSDRPRVYEGRWIGKVTYDRAKGRITRFDLVAVGSYRGFWLFHKSPTEGALVGFAFELAGENAAIADTAPVGAILDGARYLSSDK